MNHFLCVPTEVRALSKQRQARSPAWRRLGAQRLQRTGSSPCLGSLRAPDTVPREGLGSGQPWPLSADSPSAHTLGRLRVCTEKDPCSACCSAVAVWKFIILFGQEAPHFHFAQIMQPVLGSLLAFQGHSQQMEPTPGLLVICAPQIPSGGL